MPRPTTPEGLALGRVIRRLRTEQEMTQEDFAHVLGVHRNFLSSVERGVAVPTIVSLRRMARGLRMRASELVALVENELGD